MNQKIIVAGVGMIPFVKPGANEPYPVMAGQATRLALADAGVDYDHPTRLSSAMSTAIRPAASARSTSWA